MVSDATMVVPVPGHLDVASLSKLHTPATNEADTVTRLNYRNSNPPPPLLSKRLSEQPVFDEPVVLSVLTAVTHNQRAVVHLLGACVVHVNTCWSYEAGAQNKIQEPPN